MIIARGLVKNYGPIEAVKGIDLTVSPGEIFGFLGPNGAGKSTTIGMLTTLIAPTLGQAEVAGINLVTNPGAVRQRIGLVFQDPSLDNQLTARENLEFHAFLYGLDGATRRRRIEQALEMVELSERANSLVMTYSGGMKRRLEIARGMLHYPKVLFLDEPTLGLDPQTRARIWLYLRGLRQSEGTTIFMSTRYMDEAEFCDRIAIIDHGKIAALGTPEELKGLVGSDMVTLKTTDNQAAAERIREQFGLESTVANEHLSLEVEDGASFVPRLIQGLPGAVITVSLTRPSLDAAFIKLTGRAIRDQEADPQAQLRGMARRWGGQR